MNLSFPAAATILWVLAFLCSFTWLPAYEPEALILTLAGLFAALGLSDGAGLKLREWPTPRLSPVLISGGLLWLTVLVSVATSDILYVSWIWFFIFSILPLSILFFLVGHDAEARFRWAWIGIRLVLAGLALFALWQYFFMPRWLTNIGRVHEPLADPNSLAAVFSLGLVLTVGSILKSPARWPWCDLGLLTLLGIAFFTTGSRTATLVLALASLALIILIGPRAIARRYWILFGGLAVGAFLLTAFVIPVPNGGWINLISMSVHSDQIEKPLTDRLDIWSGTLKVIRDHVWTGTGAGTFYAYYAEFRSPTDTTVGLAAHNDPLQFAAEFGIFAPILFYGTILLALLRTCRVLKLVPKGDPRRLDLVIPLLALGAMTVHAHTTYLYYVLPCLFLGGYCFARWYDITGAILAETPLNIRFSDRWPGWALEGGLMVVTCIAIIATACPIYTQRLIANAQSAEDVHSFALNVNLSDTLALGTNAQSYALAAKVPLGALGQTEKPLSEDERAMFIAQAHKILNRGERVNPREVTIYELQAQLANFENDPALAEDLLRKAVKIDPLQISARIAFSEQLIKNGKKDEAAQMMQEAIDRRYSPSQINRYVDLLMRTMALQEEIAKEKKARAGHP